MDAKELLKVTAWTKVHNDNLKALYEQYKADTGDNKMPFAEFCVGMYHNCKH